MHRCPRCHTSVDDGDKFCDNCGLRLNEAAIETSAESAEGAGAPVLAPGICSACGYKNLPGEMFCENCGVQLAPVASIPPPPPIRNSVPAHGSVNQITSQEASADVICHHCGKTNRAGTEFCQDCGTQLADIKGHAAAQQDFEQSPISNHDQDIKTSPGSPHTDQIEGKFILRRTGDVINLNLEKSELLIGRTDITRSNFPEIDLVPFGGEKAGVSRKHAHLVAQGSQLFVQDLNSTNFTFINDQRLEPGKSYLLNSGDKVRFGMLELEFQAE